MFIFFVVNVWYVFDVFVNFFVDVVFLFLYSDYIFGSLEGVLYGEVVFGEFVEDFIGCLLCFYVYNNEYNVICEVIIILSCDWGG